MLTRHNPIRSRRLGNSRWWTLLLLLAALACVAPAWAQLPPAGAPSQFDITGFIEEAILDPACAATDTLCGGTIKVNGHVITVPANTIVQFPANAISWQQIFAQAPPPYGLGTTPPSSGLALADLPAALTQPLTTYEAHVVGNKVGNVYIAGLIDISQQALNSGQGYINFIDYAKGEMRVGGIIGDPNCVAGTLDPAAGGLTCSGARVRINDPIVSPATTGKFSMGLSPDPRFTLDPDNPTVRSATGFPMCLPRTDPAVSIDPLCPQTNRAGDGAGGFLGSFTMLDPASIILNPTVQAPFEVGDFVTFAGTLVQDAPPAFSPIQGPWPTATPPASGTDSTYISAHTLINNIAIYTAAGTNPAYTAIDVTLLGVGGTTTIGLTEAAVRTRFEGFTTDPTRTIHLYGLDLDCSTGATTPRDWGTIGVDPGPPNGAVKGRWRFRPPCTATTPTDKACTPPAAGSFLPATRMVQAVIEGLQGQSTTTANGLVWGQYQAPITEYIFPEQVIGSPVPPANFETMPFLAQGGQIEAFSGVVAGQLAPWPGIPAPLTCAGLTTAPPVANAGISQTVASGALVTLDGSASTGGAPLTFAWTAPAGITLSSPNSAVTTFAAPFVGTATPLTFGLTVTNPSGSSTASVTVTVNAVGAPTAFAGATQVVFSGTPVTLHGSGTDPNGLALTYQWTQGGPTAAAWPVTLSPSATVQNPTFTLTLPLGQPQVVLWFTLTVTNSLGVTSAPDVTTVTVQPLADLITITLVEYRTGKQRLTVNATSSVVSPNVDLTLQQYTSTAGVQVPGGAMTNLGAGNYQIVLVGVPQPDANGVIVTSNLGGNATSPITRLRQ